MLTYLIIGLVISAFLHVIADRPGNLKSFLMIWAAWPIFTVLLLVMIFKAIVE